MQRLLFILLFTLSASLAYGQSKLEKDLARTYIIWQKAMVNKDVRGWDAIVASERKKEVKNRIYSERLKYPAQVFNVPIPPPAVTSLKMLQAKAEGDNAKAVFFGKIDFSVGGKPEDNLLVVSYQNQAGYWRFVKAEYVNLTALKGVREQIYAKDYSYLKHEDFQPAPFKRTNFIELNGAVPIITKVYAYCPGREVKAMMNSRSNHLFQNVAEAEVAIGGANVGNNSIEFSVKKLPGGQGSEPLCMRVYLFSQVNGVKPIKAYEYLVKEGEKVKTIQSQNFIVTKEMVAKLLGK